MSEDNDKNQIQAIPDEGTDQNDTEDNQVAVSYELNEPRWSVVTFEKCAARSLTYDEAFQVLERLRQEKEAGLCIVTDDAASRISPEQ